jgi:hypothetical protein
MKRKSKKKHVKNIDALIKKWFGCCDLFSFDYEYAKFLSAAMKAFVSANKTFPSYPWTFKGIKEWREFVLQISKDIDGFINNEFETIKDEDRLRKIAHKAIMRFAKNWWMFWM